MDNSFSFYNLDFGTVQKLFFAKFMGQGRNLTTTPLFALFTCPTNGWDNNGTWGQGR